MAIETIVTEETPDELGVYKTLHLLMRSGTEIRQSSALVLLAEDVTSVNIQTAWAAGAAPDEPLRAWSSYQGREGEFLDGVILEMLNQLKEGGTLAEGNTLAKITLAGRNALSERPLHLAAGTRLNTLFKAASTVQQADFVTLLAVLILSRSRE